MRFYLPLLMLTLFTCTYSDKEEQSPQTYDGKTYPSEHLYFQRTYPEKHLSLGAMQKEVEALKSKEKKLLTKRQTGQWQTEGPGNAGARINTIAVAPENPDRIYLGYSGGGIYTTGDGGKTWVSSFDDHPFLSIGHLVAHPHRPGEVYAGTGDPNISGTPFTGNGIYKSTDYGKSWIQLGLEETGIISRILIDPTEDGILYAATMGHPYFRDQHRGLYKSTDSGATWEQILFLSDSTGVIDLVMDPVNSQTLYAAGWDRIRNYEESSTYGKGARIYKTVDGGKNWEMLRGGLPLNIHSRIGLVIAPSNPDRLYAVYVDTDHQVEAIYTTGDGGERWSALPTDQESGLSGSAFGGFGWYFGKLAVHPDDEQELYLLGVRLWKWHVALKTWKRSDLPTLDAVHADMHSLIFLDGENLLLGTDGGLYKSTDRGEQWRDIENIPTTQFYRVAYNPHYPGLYFGGAQDNGSLKGNLSNINDWQRYFGGDGFRTLFHPLDSQIWYVQTQLGGLAVTEDGSSFKGATRGINARDRINWDAPVIMSRHDPDVLYYGTDRVYRSMSGTEVDFESISQVLTDDTVLLALTSNLSALEESFFNPDIIFAGTGDGNLWRTVDAATSWSNISADLPDRYITSVHASPYFEHRLYVSHSGYKAGVNLPHVHMSEDLGNTWTNISGDLPSLPVNDLLILPGYEDQVIFAATDGGVYITQDAGNHWRRLGQNMPYIPVFDLTYNTALHTLVAGTFGKSILSYDLSQENFVNTVSVKNSRLSTLIIYPNPARHELCIQGKQELDGRLEIYNVQGQRILKGYIQSKAHLDISSLPPGSYFVTIASAGNRFGGRFIKY